MNLNQRFKNSRARFAHFGCSKLFKTIQKTRCSLKRPKYEGSSKKDTANHMTANDKRERNSRMLVTFLIFLSLHATLSFCFHSQLHKLDFKDTVHKARLVRTASPDQVAPKLDVEGKKQDNAKEEFIPAVFNNCYGGFGLSEFAKQLYRKRYKMKFCVEYECYDYMDESITRDCPILVDLVKDFPCQVSKRHANLKILYHHTKYKGFFRVHEYDGLESPYIDIAAYKLHTIETIAASALNAEKQMEEIKAVLVDTCDDVDLFDAPPTEGGEIFHGLI